MTEAARSAVVIGAGVFGVTGALALRRRGWRVTLLDSGPLPHVRASSTDLCKVVRMDYGADDLFTDLAAEAMIGWDRWNASWPEPLYCETGFALMAGGAMVPGSFEHESFTRMQARDVPVERIDGDALCARFPVWVATGLTDGYFNPRAGWAASGRVMERLIAEARAGGVAIHAGKQLGRERGSRVVGVEMADGESLDADITLVAAGAWTPHLLPHLQDVMWVTGQPLVYLRPKRIADFQPPRFCCWAADITRTGWYGFPDVGNGIVKIGNHGAGVRVHPDELHGVPADHLDRTRSFLAESLPDLLDAEIVKARLCLYCDAWDGAFTIDHDPARPGLAVAAGGSGHGFKFAPVLGDLIADAVERRENRFLPRFRWRPRGEAVREAARAS